MSNVIMVKSIADYANLWSLTSYHPLLGVFDMCNSPSRVVHNHMYGFNMIVLKNSSGPPFLYGDETYSYRNGSIIVLSPYQLVGPLRGYTVEHKPTGRVLAWSNDMFHGTRVSQMYFDYLFFSYRSNTSLDVNDEERSVIIDSMNRLDAMLKDRGPDVNIIISAQILSDILDVCMKAFKRQIDLFCMEPRGLLSMTEYYLLTYFKRSKAAKHGLPRVGEMARACGLDESYYGTRFYHLTGLHVKEFIQQWMIDTAKNRLSSGWAGLDTISKGLGFTYPNHFSTFFKSMTGMTPTEYRMNRFRQLRLHRTEAGLDL